MPLELSTRQEGGLVIHGLEGALDSGQVKIFREKVLESTPQASAVLIDCRALSYLDSSGLAAFVGLHKSLVVQEKRFVIFGLSDSVMRVVRFTKLDQILSIFDSEEAAVQAAK